jgi:hypothetical protein
MMPAAATATNDQVTPTEIANVDLSVASVATPSASHANNQAKRLIINSMTTF